MRKSEITIHDIAQKLNISASTVSRALKNSPLISEATRNKIQAAATKMGYRPNSIAANLRTKKTNNIGIIVPWINRHFFSSVVSGVEEVAYNAGFTVTIAQSNDNYQKEMQIAKSFFYSRIDGVIVSFSMETRNFSHFRMFAERRIPLLFFDRDTTEFNANRIVVDDFAGGEMVTNHLIEQGCRNIAHISGPLHLSIYDARLKGYLAALQKAGLPLLPGGILHNRLTRYDGEKAILQLLTLKPAPDAVFCANDTTALSAIMYLKKAGYKIPDDIAIVGFSDEPYSELITPSISTIRQPGCEIGEKAAQLIISEIKGEITDKDYRKYIMHSDLIVRESSLKKV